MIRQSPGSPPTSSKAYLVERESIGADPGMLHVILTIMEHLAVELFISIVAALLANAVELGLLEQGGEAVGFLLLLIQLLVL